MGRVRDQGAEMGRFRYTQGDFVFCSEDSIHLFSSLEYTMQSFTGNI